MRKQGYNARLDDSLGERRGKESGKKQSFKDRRDESKGMEKSSGKRAYSADKGMDAADHHKAIKHHLSELHKMAKKKK